MRRSGGFLSELCNRSLVLYVVLKRPDSGHSGNGRSCSTIEDFLYLAKFSWTVKHIVFFMVSMTPEIHYSKSVLGFNHLIAVFICLFLNGPEIVDTH